MDILVQTPVDEGEDYDPKTDDLPPEAPTPAAQNVFTRRPAGVRLPKFGSCLSLRQEVICFRAWRHRGPIVAP